MKLIQEQEQRIKENLAKIKHRIVVFSGKGGVGKTTVSVNLAYALAKKGTAVGLLDADITGPNVPQMLGLKETPFMTEDRILPQQKEGVKVISLATIIPPNAPVIWRGPMRSKALDQFLGDVEWGELDFLVADLPPGTGDEVMTMTQKMEPDLVIVVTTPQEMSLIDCRRAVNMAKKMGLFKIGIVENMSGLKCPKCGHEIDIFGSGGGEQAAMQLGALFLGKIPFNLKTREGADIGKPIVLEDEGADISLALMKVAAEVMEFVGEKEAEG